MTIQNITMPQLGESVTEGTIERWLIKPGDQVKKYDALAEVQTDKVTAELQLKWVRLFVPSKLKMLS